MMAERVSDAKAVVDLMNSIFRHSECGPLRAETVLRSCRAQVGHDVVDFFGVVD